MMSSTPRTFVGTTTFQVTGMTCGHCKTAVTEELCRLDGVQHVEVDVDSGTVTVHATGPIDRADIASAVDEAGYLLVP